MKIDIKTTTLSQAGGSSKSASLPPKPTRSATRTLRDDSNSDLEDFKTPPKQRTYGTNKSKHRLIKNTLMPSKKKKTFDVLSDDEAPNSQTSVGSLGISKMGMESDDEFESLDTLLPSSKRAKQVKSKPQKKPILTSDSDVQIIEEEHTIDLISTADLLSKAMAEKKTLAEPIQVLCPHCDSMIRIKPSDPPRLYDSWTLYEQTKKSKDSYSLGYAFHKAHDAFEKIVPAGVKKGYPQTIDFEGLKNRVDTLFDKIREIITEKTTSHFHDLASERYSKLGRKAHGTFFTE